MPRPGIPAVLANLWLAAVSVVVALGAAELLLRTVVPPSRAYYVLPPSSDWTLIPVPGLLSGVGGVSHFRTNRFGMRGRAFADRRAEFRILAVGGSTTRCVALDETEVWTHLLEVDLGNTADGRGVWVGNVGRDATTTRHHAVQLKYLLPQYPHIDVVISLVGVNDMMSALHQGWQYRPPTPVTEPNGERKVTMGAFEIVPGRLRDQVATVPLPWYKATELWQLGRRAKGALWSRRTFRFGRLAQRRLEQTRLERQTATTWVDSLPPLEAPLGEYRRNLNMMADLAAAAGVRLVFVTQPSVWREGMSGAEDRLLVFGAVTVPSSPRAYFTTRALGRAMARYNETLLEVCRERGLDCVDAARLLPRDTTAMYDDVHLNENGSRLLAQVLVEHFRTRPPFRR